MEFQNFKVGEKVKLINNYLNKFLCNFIEIDLEDMVGVVEIIDLTDNLSEKCININGEAYIMKYFPCWEKAY